MLLFAQRALDTLSDGERQKVLIARALAQNTPFIFLDEPTAHLDLPNRIEVFKLLKKLAQQYNKAILITTHELDWAIKLTDYAWVLDKEGNLTQGQPEQLLEKGVFQQVFKLDNELLSEIVNHK